MTCIKAIRQARRGRSRKYYQLAFFFASIDRDPQLAEKIIVIDDPMTGLDEHRWLTAVLEVRRLLMRVCQIIVLSHSQAELAEVVHVNSQTIGRSERGETPIQPAAETLIRRLVIERLGLDAQESIEELARRCRPHAGIEMIRIDASSTGAYRLAA